MNEKQVNEFQALKSIYFNEIESAHFDDDQYFTLSFPEFSIHFTFISDYPEIKPPIYKLEFKSPPVNLRQVMDDIDAELQGSFEPGNEIVFTWIQIIQDKLSSIDYQESALPEDKIEMSENTESIKNETMDMYQLPIGCPTLFHSNEPLIDR